MPAVRRAAITRMCRDRRPLRPPMIAAEGTRVSTSEPVEDALNPQSDRCLGFRLSCREPTDKFAARRAATSNHDTVHRLGGVCRVCVACVFVGGSRSLQSLPLNL